jgi:ATP-dependent helicase/nuclease subunit B
VNEVREVLRRCLAENIPLDDVEILHTDTETYAPLIYAIARRYFSDADRSEGIPVTFAEGIPASLSRPGRALVAWLQWIADGYPQRRLVELIENGLLQCGDDGEVSFSLLARLLRPLAIGQNAAHYLPKLDEQITAMRKPTLQQVAELEVAELDGQAGEDEPNAIAARARKLNGLLALRKLISGLLDLSRKIEQGSGTVPLQAVTTFLNRQARSISELDRFAAESLLEQLAVRQLWLQRLDVALDLRQWLLALPAQTRVLGSGPRPGHLHVAHVRGGGHSSRRRTFVIGLDDRRFPGAALQDPILLDRERASLSSDLPTSSGSLQQRSENLARTLSRLPGRVTLSWPCYDLAEDRESFPCSFLLSAYRLLSGKQDADMAALNLAVGPPASFAPSAPEQALDESERWLWRLSEEDVRGTDQLAGVEARFSHLARGSHARRAGREEFGPFSGLVPRAGQDLDPFASSGPVLSASALETVGRCPRAFFFRNGLKLYPPDELDFDHDRWLDAAQFGLLLHEAFRRFMAELTKAGNRPAFERDHAVLAAILQECVAKWRNDVPPPNENAYRIQYWRLVRTAKLFLQAEEEFCRSSQPRFFEVALGLPRVDAGSPLDDENPLAVPVAGGQSIRARGQIDRVDQIGDQQFVVWDYKVGSGYGYVADDPFRQGRRVQSLLYLRMIETALREKLDPQAAVAGFGYFFPSVRSFGLRVQWDAQTLSAGAGVLGSLCELIRAGAFLATNQKDDCRFCDYQAICGDAEQLATHSQALLDRADLIALQPLRELRRG